MFRKFCFWLFAVCAASSLVAAEIVAKFGALTDGAVSLGYQVAAQDSGGGFCVSGNTSWSVNEGLTVIVSYAGLSMSGDQALVSWARSGKDQQSYFGVMASDGKLKGVYSGEAWGTAAATALAASGTLVITYRANEDNATDGVTVYNAAGQELYRSSRLKESKSYTLGAHFDFGNFHDLGCAQEGLTIEGVEILRGVVTADEVTSVVAAFEKTAASEDFFWENGGSPRGWFSKWTGEAGGAKQEVLGPQGIESLCVVHDENGSVWHPYADTSSKERYTLAVYGSVDLMEVEAGHYAVLWSLGRANNSTVNGHVLAKNDAGEIVLLQVSNGRLVQTVRVGSISGYHLITVVFDQDQGARVYLDQTAAVRDVAFTAVPGGGLQVGALFGGFSNVSAPMARGDGFVPLALWGSNETADASAVAALAARFPAVSVNPTDRVQTELPTGAVLATGPSLRLSEIMPKPVDKPVSAAYPATLARMDPNGLESGWVELENTGDDWVNLADYKFSRTNRSKKTSNGYGNFPALYLPPRARFVFWTSERYANSADMSVSAFATPDPDGVHPKYYADSDMLIWPDKINPKKSPFVRLTYAPAGGEEIILDTVVIPSDIPEGHSLIIDPVVAGRATTRWMTAVPTRGTANTTTDLIPLGPNAGPLYEIKGGTKHDSANEFARLAPPAVPGENYTVTFAMNPTPHPTTAASSRAEDAITAINLIYRTGLDDATRKTVAVDLATKTTDAKDWGDVYTAEIPSADFPAAGQLIQWKFEVTDAAGNTWTTPSFHNKDDGYEWYGTIVEPPASQVSATLPTWHLFADAASLEQMDVDVDAQNLTKVPHNARVAIYDSSTSNYYDYVRIDLRGNTSKSFTKKSHGLRFAKAHPMTMTDVVSGETVKEIRKTSLISEFADPSRMRQMIAFWLWRKMGNKVPFDFPVRCNLNGAFYQLAFNSERFTDELIEDVYGFDKFGYGYKNVGTMKSGTGTTAGGIEKKTPDDGNEKDISVLQTELRARIRAVQQVSGDKTGASSTGLDNAEVTKFVVEKFNLPAWLNYLASARITQEMDDVWANVSAYYDNAAMKEGVRGTGTWLPLGYDFNLSFGQYYRDGGLGTLGLMANQDWFKSHPFYGGNRVMCYKGESGALIKSDGGNDGFEAVWQSAKFRRLYLRRLRTLMDQELGAPDADETFETSTTPFIVKMREMLAVMEADAAADLTKWPNDTTDDKIDVWPSAARPQTIEAGVRDIYENYLVPRRQHLYVTHSVTNTARAVGYGTNLNAGIPEAQSAIAVLKDGISAVYDACVNAVVIRNTNAETIDLSGWNLSGPVTMLLPAGTVIDAGSDATPGEVYVTADRRATITALGEAITDQVVVGNGGTGKAGASITLRDADGVRVVGEPTEQENYLRVYGFCGAPKDPNGSDTDEFVILTNLNQNAQLDVSGALFWSVKAGDPTDDANALRAKVTLPKKTVIPAGGWLRLDQTWTKITDGDVEVWLYDSEMDEIQHWAKISQKNLGVKETGYYAKYDFAADAWTKELIILAPGYNPVVEPGGVSVEVAAASAEAAEAAVTLKTEVPTEVAALVTPAVYAGYFKPQATAVAGVDGRFTVAAVLNPGVVPAPVMGATETQVAPFTIASDAAGATVSISVVNAKVGLWYGCEASDDVRTGYQIDLPSFILATRPDEKLVLHGSPRDGTSAFFRVKVLPVRPQQ